MNKIYRLKWNRSRNCWSVCSELGSRVKGKKSRAVLISAISLYSSLVFADDVIVNQDKAIDFGKENQSIDYRITVTDNANLVINATDTSRPRLTLASGGGLDITGGKVTINGPLNFLLKGTGFLNVSNAGSELYADDLYESNSGMRHDRGYFNVSNGGKIHVKGTSRLTYLQGNVSGEGSQVNSKTFFMGVYGSYGGNQYLSVNNGGEVNASEKISLGYYDQNSDTTLAV
ncbi:ESPR domain-containing protein, partial [Shigella boydii]|nr:ESPR domain-containing protein [Shigella boydii]